MSESVRDLNATWAGAVLDRLSRHGVRHLCFAPGSRSAPLALAAARRASHGEPFQLHTHFDERGLAYYALGLIRATGGPIAVVTTSGTAAPNLHPAMSEARQSRLPLIAVTADRPPELHDCGANQAISQQRLFEPQVRASIALPPPEKGLGRWLAGRLDAALKQALAPGGGGPVHINAPFREPLYGGEEQELDPPPLAPSSGTTPRPPALGAAEPPLLLVAGELTRREAHAALATAEAANIPILADLSSQLRLLDHPCVIPDPELLLASAAGREACSQARQVIQLGGRLIGRHLPTWLASQAPARWLVTPSDDYLDPDWLAQAVHADIPSFCQALRAMPQDPLPGLAEAAQEASRQRCLVDAWPFAEPQAAATLSRLLPSGMALFAGNSLPARVLNLFARPGDGPPCLTQRGASGIDGLLATAAGYAAGAEAGVTLVLGDLSVLHDINSLALLARAQHRCIAVVLNNDGGGIFDLLPAREQGEAHTHLFRMPHGYTFAQVAAQFDLPYERCSDAAELELAYERACYRGGASVIEAICPPERGADQIAELFRQL